MHCNTVGPCDNVMRECVRNGNMTVTRCYTLQYTALQWAPTMMSCGSVHTIATWLQHTVTRCNTLQYSGLRRQCNAEVCTELQHDCNTLQHTATQWAPTAMQCGSVHGIASWLQHTATHCNTLQYSGLLRWCNAWVRANKHRERAPQATSTQSMLP